MSDRTETAENSQAPENNGLSGWKRFAVELGPLLVFFAANHEFGIFTGTGAFMVATLAAMIASWHFTRHIAPMLWVTTAVVAVFGGLTLYLNDETFIKLKPTIVNAAFAIILGFGLLRGKSLLKSLLGSAFPPMSDAGWNKLTRNWALFFVFMAVLNELVWRNVSTDLWVSIKVFGYIPITLLFAISQTPLLLRHQTDQSTDGNG